MRILRYFTSTLLFLSLFSACREDELSTIGESVQPREDKVDGIKRELELSASTVASGRAYSDNLLGVLGEITDPSFGDFKGGFVTQVRTAPGFKFTHEPVNNRIDSAALWINFSSFVGDMNAPIKVGIYELQDGFDRENYSVADLDNYLSGARLIGSQEVVLSRDIRRHSPNGVDSIYFIPIGISAEVGQRIYEESKDHPEYFESQESFNRNVFGGLAVTTTTGRGVVLQTVGVTLVTYYSYEGKNLLGADTTLTYGEAFINTRQTAQVNELVASRNDELLQPSDQYSYVSSPAGVSTVYTIPKEQLEQLFEGLSELEVGKNWVISDATFSVRIDRPTDLVLNPPLNMLLIDKSIGKDYFLKLARGESLPTAYVSSTYSTASNRYTFRNIGNLLMEHLKKESYYEASSDRMRVKQDLEVQLIPVEVTTRQGAYGTSTQLSEYLFPSIVRLGKTSEDLKLDVVSSKFYN